MGVAAAVIVIVGVYAAALVHQRRRAAPARVLMAWQAQNLVLWPLLAMAAAAGAVLGIWSGGEIRSLWDVLLFAVLGFGAIYLLLGVHGSVELHAALSGERRDEAVSAAEHRAIRRSVMRWSPVHVLICMLTMRRYRAFAERVEKLPVRDGDDDGPEAGAWAEDGRFGLEVVKAWWRESGRKG